MSSAVKLIALLFCTLAPQVSLKPIESQPWYIFGSNAGQEKNNWIKIVYLGPINHPSPVIWISTQYLYTRGFPEIAFTVDDLHLNKIAKAIPQGKCVNKDYSAESKTLLITKKDNLGIITSCRLDNDSSCLFIKKVIAAEKVHNELPSVESLRELGDNLLCAVTVTHSER